MMRTEKVGKILTLKGRRDCTHEMRTKTAEFQETNKPMIKNKLRKTGFCYICIRQFGPLRLDHSVYL